MDPKRYTGHKYPKKALQVASSRAHSLSKNPPKPKKKKNKNLKTKTKQTCKVQTDITKHFLHMALFPQLTLQNPKETKHKSLIC